MNRLPIDPECNEDGYSGAYLIVAPNHKEPTMYYMYGEEEDNFHQWNTRAYWEGGAVGVTYRGNYDSPQDINHMPLPPNWMLIPVLVEDGPDLL